MFKARPPSGNSLKAVPTRRTALPATRLLAVLAALALAAALFGVLPVQGQTPTVLVSNTGQTVTDNAPLVALSPERAQGFTTGTNEGGYTLSSIGVSFDFVISTAASRLTATLNEASGSNPGDVVCTLDHPSSYASSGVNTYDAPSSGCPTLTASTTYFFVLKRTDLRGGTIALDVEDSTDEDDASAPGWSIGDKYRFLVAGSWTSLASSDNVLMIEVKGTETDTTPPGLLRTDITNTVNPNGTRIILAFDEVLDGTESGKPPASAFSVTADGNDIPVTEVNVRLQGWVALDLDLPIGNGQVVKVSYEDPTSDNDPAAIQDLAGNDAASFTDFTLPHNDSDLPSVPQNLTATEGTELVTLSWTTLTNLVGGPRRPIDRFELRQSTDHGENWSIWVTISTSDSLTSYDVTGLDLFPGTHFTFQLRAVNTTGNGPAATAQLLAVGPPGVTVSESALTIAEGGSGTYTIVLDNQPTADVTIIIGGDRRVSRNPYDTTFTPSTWNTPKTVILGANQDDDAVDESVDITHTVAQGSAAEYFGLSIDGVDVTVVDDDEAGVTLSKDRLTIAEGGSATYTVVLDTEPSGIVTIIIGAVGLSIPPFLPTFNPSNWSTPTTVTVGANQDDDAVDESVDITHTVAQGSAAEYFGLSIADVVVTVLDDDVPPKVTITSDAPAPVSAPFRVTITFDRAVTGFEVGDVTGWYAGTPFSFNLTDLREETSGLVYSAGVDHILDGRLKVIVESDVAQVLPQGVGNTPGLLSIEVDAPDPGPEPGGTDVWSATMTAGDSNPGGNATGFIGYGRADTVNDLGEIDTPTFTWQGTDYTVRELIHTPAWATVDLLLSEPLPNNGRGMTLHLGGGRWLRFGDYQNVKMTVVDEVDDSRYIWQAVLLGWEQDDSVAVSIKVAGGQAAPQSANTPATGAPTISGAPRVGETLTAGTSGIEDEDGLTGVSFGYQWLVRDDGADTEIPGATASTYTLFDADEGKTFLVRVTFTDDGGNEETLTSHAVAAAPQSANTPAAGLPAISGTVQVGETLTADTSGITDEDGLDYAVFSHQWIASDGSADSDIQDATGSTYTLAVGDEGKTIKVKVTFTDDGGNEETLTSAATAAVEPTPAPPPAPTNLTAVVNEDGWVTLTWDAPDDDSVTGYQILRRRPYEGEKTLLVYVENTGSTATTYTDTNVTSGVRYVYRVKVINAAGLSQWSNYARATP